MGSSGVLSEDEAFELSEGSDSDFNGDPETPITEPQTPNGSGRKILSCPFQDCTKSFNRQARLTEHIRSHTNERPFRCPEQECDKAFLRDSHLKHHITSAHTDERNYPCVWANCDKKFATGTRLRRHEASHQVKEKYTCKGFDGCDETFRKHATLSRHILSVHEKKKPFPCTEFHVEKGEQCGLGFDTAEKLRSHKRAVHDQTRFVCTDCTSLLDDMDLQVSFATYALLQAHVAEIHPPACPHCFLLCASEKDLRRHLELSHSISDPQADNSTNPVFPCTYPDCTRSFSKKGNLNVHVKTVHEHRKDFVCGKTDLKLPSEIRQQVDSELGQSSEITGCGRHFTSKATLEEHVRTAHLGMNSKRQERNRKRQAERAADAENQSNEIGGKAKKKRKSRATKSAISELTGCVSHIKDARVKAEPGVGNPFDSLPYPVQYNQAFHQEYEAHHQGSDQFFLRNDSEEIPSLESSVNVDLNGLAASALVDPALLTGRH